MPRLVLGLLALGAVGFAGCHETVPDVGEHGDETWRIGGTFTEDATSEDLDDLRLRLEDYDATLQVMERFPMQYSVRGPVEEDCPAVREMLLELEYVTESRDCQQVIARRLTAPRTMTRRRTTRTI